MIPPGITPGDPGDGGYRPLLRIPRAPHLLRRDLGGCAPSGHTRPLVSFVHVTDLHVTDAQSPSRVEYLDRLGEVGSPVVGTVGRIGTYRPQETLTHQVVEAMARALRAMGTGPVLGGPVSFAVSTGDAADNAQYNEVHASIALLTGGATVIPDSGDPDRYDGVGGSDFYDLHYWHPGGTPPGEVDDLPRACWGYPVIPDLLDAARRPFTATGFGLPWFPVAGNHDLLLAGTVPPSPRLGRVSTGGRKLKELPPAQWGELARILHDHARRPPDVFVQLAPGPFRRVASDRRRGFVDSSTWRSLHPMPDKKDRAYYSIERGPLTFVMLDTVNPEGGWQGSLDHEQFTWLEATLQAGSSRWKDGAGTEHRSDRPDRLFVLCSHHPLDMLVNPWSTTGVTRVLAPQVEALLRRFPNVVAWVNGHTHRHRITPVCTGTGTAGGAWEITTASHIDWPQQSRVIEVGFDPANEQLVIATTTIDHTGRVDPHGAPLDDIDTLAGWSRELAANHWPYRDAIIAAGPHSAHRDVIAVRPLPSHLVGAVR